MIRPRPGAPVLVSVNVGLPKNVPGEGKTVYTGAWKHPVRGPAMARRLDIDGDGQSDLAGHGGGQRAVLVYGALAPVRATAMTTPTEPSPDQYAVSPAIGPVPGIYVHLSPAHANTHPQHVPTGGTMSDIPAGLRYSTDHLWLRPGADGLVRVGVTDFAQQSLGDVVNVSPPKPGDTVTAGEACGDIESVKSVSDLIAPVTGTVRASNEDLAEAPDLVNTDPYGQGWLFEIRSDPVSLGQQLTALMDAGAYHHLVGA